MFCPANCRCSCHFGEEETVGDKEVEVRPTLDEATIEEIASEINDRIFRMTGCGVGVLASINVLGAIRAAIESQSNENGPERRGGPGGEG